MGEDGGNYVHDPSTFDSRGESDGDRSANRDAHSDADRNAPANEPETAAVDAPGRVDPSNREFGRRGWILVGVIAFAFVICPLAILLWPPGFGYRFALLILPLAPAVLLAITAVWATTRP